MFYSIDQIDSSKMTKDPKLILVGVISSAHGIKGDIMIRSFTDPVENITKLNLLDGKNNEFTFKRIRTNTKGTLICRHNNCTDRNQAEDLVGTELYSYRDELPQEDEGEFYFEDLKDLKVRNIKGKEVGTILEVHNFGAGDLIEVNFSNGSGSELYPFTKEFFPEITKDYVVLAKTNLLIK
jgi:16S rRNA processing protein RimM